MSAPVLPARRIGVARRPSCGRRPVTRRRSTTRWRLSGRRGSSTGRRSAAARWPGRWRAWRRSWRTRRRRPRRWTLPRGRPAGPVTPVVPPRSAAIVGAPVVVDGKADQRHAHHRARVENHRRLIPERNRQEARVDPSPVESPHDVAPAPPVDATHDGNGRPSGKPGDQREGPVGAGAHVDGFRRDGGRLRRSGEWRQRCCRDQQRP